MSEEEDKTDYEARLGHNPLSAKMLAAIEAVTEIEDNEDLAGILDIIANKASAREMPIAAGLIRTASNRFILRARANERQNRGRRGQGCDTFL